MRIILVIISLPLISFGQEYSEKNSFYISWGYNRGWYTKSDIHFKGEGYDFTLWDVPAHDYPEKFDPDMYLNPKSFTIPQFNFRIGYFFREKYSISLGWDHMKYYMQENIYVNVSGYLNEGAHDNYSFNLDNEPYFLSRNFLEYEHSDGFNYIRLNIDRKERLFSIKKFDFSWNAGVGTGGALTWSDLSWGNTRYRNRPHFSGYNFSVNTGPHIQFNHHFFITSEIMAAYSWLPDVQIRYGQKEHKADQKFGFLQYYVLLGYQFKLNKRTL